MLGAIILAASLATTDYIAVIHTDKMPTAIEITEPCPADGSVTLYDAPEADERVYGDIFLTEDEKTLLKAIMALEGHEEGNDGLKAIAEVVFNRMRSDEWPNTLTDVIYQKGQFATVKYLKRPYAVPDEREERALAEVMAETETVLPNTDYVYFSRGKTNGKGFTKINHHWFSK